MSWQVVRAERTGALAAHLAHSLAAGGPDPFARELVIVPTRGIERFLTQTIADRNGIAANIEFPLPMEFLGQITDAANDPWTPERLTWPLLRVIHRSTAGGEAWAAPLGQHLRDSPQWRRSERAYPLAARLARLFASYAMERPAMIAAWAEGEPRDVPHDLDWQYRLWREVLSDVGRGPLDAAAAPDGLPPRVFLFGPTRLPERLLSVLRQISAERDVCVYLPVASETLWQRTGWDPVTNRDADASRDLVEHPLLASLGRDARELRLRLGDRGLPLAAPERTGSQLSDLQQQIAGNVPSLLDRHAADDSLQIHACHGSMRQVEVLRDAILSLLEQHPSLQPRDVLIMTPDLDTYAPLLSAVFGDPDPRIADLRLAIADRTKEQSNEVLAALDALLRLVSGRVRRSDVLDLLKLAPVRQRFDLSESDVDRLEELSASSNVRWGLDRPHREAHLVGEIDLGTWSWGLDRMVLGTAISDHDLAVVNDVLPLPDVGSSDVGLVGRLAVVLERLTELRQQAQQLHDMRRWHGLLRAAVEDFTDARFADSWQTAHALGLLQAYVDAAGEEAESVQLSLAEVRGMLSALLAGRPTRTGFRLGGMTACQLEPMRSVPYAVVCLVGMDDGSFPRRSSRDGDDILLREPRIGERDPRSEDRQLFLDAIMAATQHLVITYTGHSERTNDPRQPAVPLAELIDLLPGGTGAVQRHPLQPFDPREFEQPTPFGHDAAALAGAVASLQPRTVWSLVDEPLAPMDPPPERSLASLARYLRDPASTFLEIRLGVRIDRRDPDVAETVPLELDPFRAWPVGDRLLRSSLAGIARTVGIAAEARAGAVPPGELGVNTLADVGQELDWVLDKYREFCGGSSPGPLTLSLDLGHGPTTVSVPDVVGTTIVRATYSTVKPEQAVGVWPWLLALAAAAPQQSWSAKVAAKGGWIELTAPPGDEALAILHRLFALRESGLRLPAPLTVETGLAYAKARLAGDVPTAEAAAAAAWNGKRYGVPEALSLSFGPDPAFEDLLAQEPLAGEDVAGEHTRFGALACSVFTPLLQRDSEAGVRKAPKGGRS